MENTKSLQQLASSITDPRQQAKVMQPFDEILLLCLCGVLAGCEGFVDISLFGREKPNSCDGWRRSRTEFLPTTPFRRCSARSIPGSPAWRSPGGRPGRPGGPRARSTAGRRGGRRPATIRPLHMISAQCGDRCLVLGQQVCRHGRNESGISPNSWISSRSRGRRDAGCDGMPTRYRRHDPREGRRLRADTQGRPGNPPR